MDPEERTPQRLLQQAKRKLDSTKSFLGGLFGVSAKMADAAECYQQAGNIFKMRKAYLEASNAFVEAAKLQELLKQRHESAMSYVGAANCIKRIDNEKSVNYFLRAIEIYTDMGRFCLAAKYHQNIAEIYEYEGMDIERAIQHYEQAADYFRGEDNHSSASKCLLKVAQFSAEKQNYYKAIGIFEEIANTCSKNSLLKFSVRDYLFKAVLCHLCVDTLNAQQAIAKYEKTHPIFQDCRESKLAKKLIGHLEEENVDEFTGTVKNMDSVTRLDPWYTTMFLRIKKSIEAPDLR